MATSTAAQSKAAQSSSESFLGLGIDKVHDDHQSGLNSPFQEVREIAEKLTNIELINKGIVANATPDASIAVDSINVASLSGLDKVLSDADATISATSTAKSAADASNVSANSAGLAIVDGNFGLNGADVIGVKSNAGLNATASTTVNAAASTSKGDAVSLATIQESAGIANISDLDAGGELSAIGKAINTITASAETVVNAIDNHPTKWNGAQATAELFGTQQGIHSQSIDASSNASVQGISSLTNNATASVTTGDLALAEGLAGTLIGANLDGIDVGGIANVTGQTTFGNTSSAANVEGDAKALSRLGDADGLISTATESSGNSDLGTSHAFEVSSDATIKGITSVTSGATAETTKGDAVASSSADNINGADFQGTLDVGGIGSIIGSANFNLSASATSVTPDDSGFPGGAQAFAGEQLLKSVQSNVSRNDIPSLDSIGLKGFDGPHDESPSAAPAARNADYGINIKSDATLSGTSIGTLKADATSTADDATAKAGGSASLTGADIGDLHVGGISALTGGAQLTSSATAENVGASTFDSLANSGLNASVTGLKADYIDVASDSTTTAQAFGTLNAAATSTGGNAIAAAGNEDSRLTGFTADSANDSLIDLNIGGVGAFSALAQGNETATASTVAGLATATAGMDLIGAEHLDFKSSSDGTLTGIAKLVATVDASNTGSSTPGGMDAIAGGNFSAIGFDDLASGLKGGAIGIGGISTLKGQAQIAGTLNAESVTGDAFAGLTGANGVTPDNASLIIGFDGLTLNGASDGTILGTASGVFNTNAASTAANASGFSNQSLRGISNLSLELGGNGGINAIVNDTNFVGAQSVSGTATAVASVDAIGLNGGDIHIAGNATIMSNVGVDSKSEAQTIA